jgi:CheY-like chemotaxis protein
MPAIPAPGDQVRALPSPLDMPLITARMEEDQPTVTPAGRQLDGATVLIVDDDVRNVFALTSALEMHGLRVLYSDNGVDGVRLLAEHPEVDIVLMDAMMPDQDGYETTRGIRRNQRFQDLPVVFLTAKAMPGDRESALAAGASDYITKPVDLDELVELMARWVNADETESERG